MNKISQAHTQNTPAIVSVGTAVPKTRFTQQQIADLLSIKTEKAKRFFLHEHIQTRHVDFPTSWEQPENGSLIEKFKKNAVALSREAAVTALAKTNYRTSDIDYLCCVTSTGFIVPSLSMLLMADMNLRRDCQRLDVVGMGCSAGLNGLAAVNNWCTANSGKVGLLICCEISSAIYVIDESENTALVNSLFGDGVAAAIVTDHSPNPGLTTRLIKFASHRVPDSIACLRFDWNSEKNLNQFFVAKETPERLGAEIKNAFNELALGKDEESRIKHWIVHTGGAAILDQLEEKLGLKPDDLRHSRNILKNFGNISSGSFLFSLKELLAEDTINSGDKGLMITMGPGLTIEMALVEW